MNVDVLQAITASSRAAFRWSTKSGGLPSLLTQITTKERPRLGLDLSHL